MTRRLFIFTSLLVFTVSCIQQDQFGPVPTAPATIPSAVTSTSMPFPAVTVQIPPALIPLYTPSIPGEEPRLVVFISEQGKFTAWIPIAGEILEYTITRTFLGKHIECPALFSRLNSASVTIQYCDLASDDIASLSNKTLLNEVRDIIRQGYRWQIQKEQIRTLEDSNPEVEVSGVEDSGGNPGTFKARIILVGHRVYFVHMYVYQTDWCYCRHQMDYVIDSFYVDSYMSIPFEPTPIP